MVKIILIVFAVIGAVSVVSFFGCDMNGTGAGKPAVVQKEEAKEFLRQQTTWTDENIRDNPYLFVRSQIEKCEGVQKSLAANRIALIRQEKSALRKAAEAEAPVARYKKFLTEARDAYQKANGVFPVEVIGASFSQEELETRVAEAQELIGKAEAEAARQRTLAKKAQLQQVANMKNQERAKELHQALKLQARQVKEASASTKMDGFKDALSTMHDLMETVDAAPTVLTLDEVLTEDPKESRKQRARDFLKAVD